MADVIVNVRDAVDSSDTVAVQGIQGASGLSLPSGVAIIQGSAIYDAGGTNKLAVDANGNAYTRGGKSTSYALTTVDADLSEVTIVAQNLTRMQLVIYNSADGNLYLSPSNGVSITIGESATNAPWVIPPSGNFTLPIPFTGALYGIWDSAEQGGANVCDFSP